MQQINPAILEEARWLDGILTEKDMRDLATRKGLPLYVTWPEPVHVAIPKRGYDAAALRTMRLVAQRRAEDCERQARDAWREVARLDDRGRRAGGGMTGQWIDVVNGFGACGCVMEGDGFYVSFCSDTGAAGSFFAGDEAAETALCKDGAFFILNGDFRDGYARLVPEGYDACKRFYDQQAAHARSSWSEDKAEAVR